LAAVSERPARWRLVTILDAIHNSSTSHFAIQPGSANNNNPVTDKFTHSKKSLPLHAAIVAHRENKYSLLQQTSHVSRLSALGYFSQKFGLRNVHFSRAKHYSKGVMSLK